MHEQKAKEREEKLTTKFLLRLLNKPKNVYAGVHIVYIKNVISGSPSHIENKKKKKVSINAI